MAQGIPARLTPRDGRKFGWLVGGAFLGLAALARWRGGDTASLALAGLGALLVGAGTLIPGRLGPVYRAWMALALAISKVTTPVFMGLLYFLVLTPVGTVMRLFGRNPLRHDVHGQSRWASHEPPTDPRTSMTRQF